MPMTLISPEPCKQDSPFQTASVLLIAAAHCIHDAYQAFLAPLLPLLMEHLGLSVMLAGSLDVIRKLPSLANPLVGLIADRKGIRCFLALGPILTTVAMSLMGLAPGFAYLAVLALMAGTGSALFHVPAPVMVRRVSADNIGRGMSLYMLGGELARTLGPLTILGAIELWGLRGTWRMIPFGIAASLILYLKVRNVQLPAREMHHEETARQSLVSFLPVLIALAGVLFFRSALKASMTIYLPTYLTSGGSSLWVAGGALSILQFAGAGGTLFSGIISDRIGSRCALIIITIVNPLLMFLFMHVSGWLVIPVLIVSGFFLFAAGPVLLSVVQQNSRGNASFINGVYMTTNFVISSLMVLIVGAFADSMGLQATFRLTAFIALGSVPFAFFIKST